MAYSDILFDGQDGIGLLTLNKPDRLNAMSWASWLEFRDVLARCQRDDAVKVLLVTGAGRGFCSGTDLAAAAAAEASGSDGASDTRSRDEKLHSHYLVTNELIALQKPTIAAINGVTAGAGFGLALGFDLRIASDQARFCAVFVRRGLAPDFGSSYLLPRIVGMSNALRMIYTGDIVDAAEALRIGLVTEVVPPEQLMERALALAGRLAKGPSLALEVAKRLAYRGMAAELADHIQFEEYLQRICLESEDAREGVRSFLEKRDPAFQGR